MSSHRRGPMQYGRRGAAPGEAHVHALAAFIPIAASRAAAAAAAHGHMCRRMFSGARPQVPGLDETAGIV